MASVSTMQTSVPFRGAASNSTENPLSQPHNSTVLENVFSIEDYERLNSFTPTSMNVRTAENITAFYLRCQALRLSPEIKYPGSTTPGWGAKLSLAGRVVEDDGPYPNKKEAKEKICGEGLKLLKELEDKGLITELKRKAEAGAGAAGGRTDGVEGGLVENWIGLLIELSRSEGTFEPIFKEYSAGTTFSCEVEIAQRPGQPFGGRTKPFSNKKAARNSAACEAVEWLRAEGLLPESGSPLKKKKTQPPSPNAKANGSPTRSVNGSPSGKVNSSPKGATDRPVSPDETESYGNKVVAKAKILGLPAPDYTVTASPTLGNGYWDVTVSFPNNPPYDVTIAEVRKIYGKKVAKEECAKRVLSYLIDEVEKKNAAINEKMEEIKKKNEAINEKMDEKKQ